MVVYDFVVFVTVVEVGSKLTFLILDNLLHFQLYIQHFFWFRSEDYLILCPHGTVINSPVSFVMYIALEKLFSFAINLLLISWLPLHNLSFLWWMLQGAGNNQQFSFWVVSCCYCLMIALSVEQVQFFSMWFFTSNQILCPDIPFSFSDITTFLMRHDNWN